MKPTVNCRMRHGQTPIRRSGNIGKWCVPAIFGLSVLAARMASANDTMTPQAAFRALVHYTLAREVSEAAERLTADAAPADAEAIRDVAQDWMTTQLAEMRRQLELAYGDTARGRFESFGEDFLAAESSGDRAFLERLSHALDIQPPPPDYRALRRWAVEQWLSTPLAEGTRLLSELQTWADIRRRDPQAPALEAWLERNLTTAAPPKSQQPPAPPTHPRNPLAEAEARTSDFDPTVGTAAGALDTFAQQRRERRARALEQAQAGMNQLAAERQAFEQEAAARKLAQAQAEAEAMKAQAQKLAAAEEEAMKQRENSWGNRLKRLVAGTIGAATGAFSGGIGAEAGRRAAMEIFR